MDGLAAGLGVIAGLFFSIAAVQRTAERIGPPRWWVPVSVFFLTICVPVAR
jgi:hypothetical protein